MAAWKRNHFIVSLYVAPCCWTLRRSQFTPHDEVPACSQDAPSEAFLMQFGLRLAQLLCPSVAVPLVLAAVRQAIGESRAAAGGDAPGPRPELQRKLELVFVHDCR